MKKRFVAFALLISAIAVSASGCYVESRGGAGYHHHYHHYRGY